MRYLVLLFSLAGLGATGYLTYVCGLDWLRCIDQVESERKDRAEEIRRTYSPGGKRPAEAVSFFFAEMDRGSKLKNWPSDPLVRKYVLGEEGDYNEKMQAFYNVQRTLPFLLSALFLGLIGIFMTFDGNHFSGAALLIVGAAAPALFLPHVLIVTGALAAAGLLALFVRPRRPIESRSTAI